MEETALEIEVVDNPFEFYCKGEQRNGLVSWSGKQEK